jgi:undecaprenyl-diphosphatase
MSVVEVILLGIIQGITEFLPVSSSGHLVLLETLFGLDAETPEMLLFDLATHVGTLVAILVVFWRALPGFGRSHTLAGKSSGVSVERLRPVPVRDLVVMIVAATFATGALVLPLKTQFTQVRGNLAVVAVMWIVTGTLLWVTDRRKRSWLDLRDFGIKGAVLVGLAQGAAVMPGISRSGATICVAVLLGLHRTRAVEFSLLIGIPAILGAAVVQSISEFEVLRSGVLPLWTLLLGGAVSAVVGIGAIEVLLMVSRAARLRYFGFYCYALAVGVLAHRLLA